MIDLNAAKLQDIIGRPVSQEESWDVAEHLLACLTHVSNARPLFGVFCTETGQLTWTAGGAEFHQFLDGAELDQGISHFEPLMAAFGIAPDVSNTVVQDASQLSPGAAMTVMNPLSGINAKRFRVVLRRRLAPRQRQVQFSIFDVTAFQETARRTRTMAAALVKALNAPVDDQQSARDLLDGVAQDLQRLFTLEGDEAISTLARDMSARVTMATDRMVAMLRTFEVGDASDHWRPVDLNPRLRPVIAAHNVPVNDWHELHSEVVRTVDGVPALIPELAEQVIHAHSFVKNAASTMLISPTQDRFFALNGPSAERHFATVEDFVRAIGVEENSTRTAVEFFSNLKNEPALSLFAVNGENVEALGRPGLYGGWQAMLTPVSAHGAARGRGDGVDVRGLFHGLKNLLLHLQVLYVVHTRADVDQVHAGLSEAAEKIAARLSDLDAIAQTGQRMRTHEEETVAQWLAAAKRVGDEHGGEVEVICDGIDRTVFTDAPSEMEDTLEELVRNAFQHGAKTVQVGALGRGDHLCLNITDDGPGMSNEKLNQVKRVLKNRAYDPDLSTRKDGTGNGLLAAANAVSRFVDGQLSVDPGPGGRGVQIGISMKLPA